MNNTASFYEAINIIGVSPQGLSECVYAKDKNEFIDYTKATVREEINRTSVYTLIAFSRVPECDADDVEKAVWKGL